MRFLADISLCSVPCCSRETRTVHVLLKYCFYCQCSNVPLGQYCPAQTPNFPTLKIILRTSVTLRRHAGSVPGEDDMTEKEVDGRNDVGGNHHWKPNSEKKRATMEVPMPLPPPPPPPPPQQQQQRSQSRQSQPRSFRVRPCFS